VTTIELILPPRARGREAVLTLSLWIGDGLRIGGWRDLLTPPYAVCIRYKSRINSNNALMNQYAIGKTSRNTSSPIINSLRSGGRIQSD